jgi:hypothetical protein
VIESSSFKKCEATRKNDNGSIGAPWHAAALHVQEDLIKRNKIQMCLSFTRFSIAIH